MADVSGIREHMEVRDAAGVTVGTVDKVEGDRIKLTRSNSAAGQHHYVPTSAVARVDAHVHLNQGAAALGLAAVGATAAAAAAAAGGEHPLPPVTNRSVDGATPRGNFYLPWIVGLIGLILLLLLFRSCVAHKETATVAAAPAGTAVVAQTSGATESTALTGLGGYLAGTGTTPRTFTFDKLHFDTSRSDVRPGDLAEVNDVAGVLKRYGQAKVKIAGYADARGPDPVNVKLGQDRADAVKAALVKASIDGGRIEAVSGGSGDPVDTNATTRGQQENRRTELVVVSR